MPPPVGNAGVVERVLGESLGRYLGRSSTSSSSSSATSVTVNPVISVIQGDAAPQLSSSGSSSASPRATATATTPYGSAGYGYGGPAALDSVGDLPPELGGRLGMGGLFDTEPAWMDMALLAGAVVVGLMAFGGK